MEGDAIEAPWRIAGDPEKERWHVSKAWRLGAILTIGLAASGAAQAEGSRVSAPLLGKRIDPRAFGTQDHTITVLSALQFRPTCGWTDAATLSRYCCLDIACTGGNNGAHYYTTLDLPAGTVIDYIGVNTATTVDAAMGFTLHFRDHLGGTAPLASFSFPAHGFGTDYAGPLGILIPANIDRVFVLDVEQAPGLEENQFFGYVEIWWRRVVSDPPAAPTFGDVPASHPFYQFIEALAKSGITGGCGSGNYCSDLPLTRGQMAVFLSKALGLHWPE
jgi:S-layer homology domain